jgi:hypothetical protein
MTEVGEAEDALASCPSRHDRVAQAPDQRRRSYAVQQTTQDPHPPPLVGLCVPEVAHQKVINDDSKVIRTAMKRATDLATFFASLARVIGPGGLRKSLVGIWRLQG